MNIAHLINRTGNGGSEVVACNLAIHQAEQHNVSIISLKPRLKSRNNVAEHIISNLNEHGVNYLELNYSNNPVNIISSAYCLYAELKRNNCDLIHLHTDHPEFLFSLISPCITTKVIRTIHNDILWPTSKLRASYSEWRLKDCETVVISDGTEQAYLRLRKRLKLSPSSLITKIKNGVPMPVNSSDSLLNTANKKLNLGFVRRITHQKGLDVLIDAMIKLKSANDFRLHVLGDGEQRKKLERIARNNNIDAIFYGTVANASSYMHQFDLLVIPSRYAGFALVPLESLFAKTPVLISDSNGLRESVPGDWPLKFESENSDSLALKLSQFSQHQYDIDALMEYASSYISGFTINNQSQKYDEVYRSLLVDIPEKLTSTRIQ